MFNCVKVCTQIQIYDSGLPLNNRRRHAVHRCMRRAFGSIAIRPRLEVRLEDRLQYELERALHHSVTDSRNRKDANFSSILRYFPPSCP
jgi:hypothetical protein